MDKKQNLKVRRRNSRVVRGDVHGENDVKKPSYMHPAHPDKLQPVAKSSGWHCDICHFLQQKEGEQRQRYRSINPDNDFNVCGDCMSAEYSAWHAKKEEFFNGHPIAFSGLRYLGSLLMTDDWPDAADRAGYLHLLDEAQQEGDLPWKSKEARLLQISPSHVKLTVDPRNINDWERYSDPKVFHSWRASDVQSITTIADAPVSFLCICVGKVMTRDDEAEATCHFLHCLNVELGESICEVARNAFEYVHTQSLLEHVDDCILAGIEGRPTAVEKKAEEDHNIAVMKQQMRFNKEVDLEETLDADPQETLANNRMSVFQLFDLNPADAAMTPTPRGSTRPSANPTPEPRAALTPSPQPSRHSPAPPSSRPSQRSKTSGDELSQDAISMVQTYMARLQSTLTTMELKEFANLLRQYRVEGDFKKFSSALVRLYGKQRKHLLDGMEAFVPTEDRPKFHLFLEAQGVRQS